MHIDNFYECSCLGVGEPTIKHPTNKKKKTTQKTKEYLQNFTPMNDKKIMPAFQFPITARKAYGETYKC